MFSRYLPLMFFTSLVSLGSALSSSADAAEKLAPGSYKIVNPVSGTWARNLPGGHQGPWLTTITMANYSRFSSVYQTWEVTAYEEGYKIINEGTRNSAFSLGQTNGQVDGFSDGFTKWYIEAAGGSGYRIHYPNKDLIWTVEHEELLGDIIVLEPSHGNDGQVFNFDQF
ncbi:hypothetical protein P691DRAFT_762584 [Macrolepiota fuliginosa MF-IS2]|uniref:Uncharacterized protein n=1 Tax=Macrolepiota fuliginosa MF-IS2 TaxID=1400762 RepID=A0A9P5X8K8_9AGAR|nr:hypothetical protein P691DRAFT_762584 [Macrolepiota fuliginosa MF-IS2]